MNIDLNIAITMYVYELKSIPDIAIFVGTSKSTIRRFLLKSGVTLRSPAEGMKLVRHKISAANTGRRFKMSSEWKENIRRGALNRKGVKGISLKPSGYIEITNGINKFKSQHVIIFETATGIKVKKNEIVHHKNEIRSDNNIDNLELMTRADHTRYHAKLHPRKRDIRTGRFLKTKIIEL